MDGRGRKKSTGSPEKTSLEVKAAGGKELLRVVALIGREKATD